MLMKGDAMLDIGKKIKDRRKELGLSIDDVAEALGKNRTTVYRYESSHIENLPISILSPLAKVLKTTPADLIGWNNAVPRDGKKCMNIDDELKKIESLEFHTPEEAMKFILEQPVLMNYGGYDLNNISADETMALAEDLLLTMKIGIERMKKKRK